MWDSMLGKGFKTQKCKTLLKLAMARIKLLRNKRDLQVKQMRKEIAQLLTSGQEPSARIRVEHIIREQNILAAYDILELFSELVAVRLPIIEAQKNCPLDLKEAISSLIFASPRCSDLPELLQIRQLFAAKYGKEFAAAAAELRPDCGVNRRIIEKLSVRAPSGEVKLKLLKEIAAEHSVSWDSADTEAELTKSHEDLLDGPNHFLGANEKPPPQLARSQSSGTYDAARDVPTRTLSRMSSDLSGLSSSGSLHEDEREPQIPFKNIPPPTKYEPPSPTKYVPPSPTKYVPPSPTVTPIRKVDTVDQVSHVPHQATSSDLRSDAKSSTSVSTRKEHQGNYFDVASAAKAAADSANRAVAAARAAAELARKQSGDFGTRVPDKLGRQNSIPPVEDEESATDLDSDGDDDDDDHGNLRLKVNSIQSRLGQGRSPAPARFSDSDSDTAEYDVPRGRGAGGKKPRSNALYERTDPSELFEDQRPPLKATKLDFQTEDTSSRPAFDDDDSGGENSITARAATQESESRTYGGSSTFRSKSGSFNWKSGKESDRHTFDVDSGKTSLHYSVMDTGNRNHYDDPDLSRVEGNHSSYDQPFAGRLNSSRFDAKGREGSPLFDEEGSIGRSREPSRLGSFQRSARFDYEDEDNPSRFSSTQKYGSNDYSFTPKTDCSYPPSTNPPGSDFSTTVRVFDIDPSPRVIEDDDLEARFEALKLPFRR
ncbi:uncharacterized protein [Physcomitrium patens]|uniref:IST1-like protein n=1 Tax=Physcomitrium patens TaxID=3218 RepID=A0A2K1JHV1_PHYPA|nr:uncharacterized protein LOC112291901 isoform X1 [Physcomitrium patens]XP_024395641.1 uncharacterized protein LOC112291901 isoform X1 [Physcomitrium patens]XP_024395642.1 uncharacterized protein LOC112291901 isoform X1 [Physcomitrium patens]XP_024395643.1 uncharacterized protein LOC112291901 isoform X1 [Physcomitrium patens]XP_024395644.1 uncharacterized protein LOC112291901 isoform X1 [Physcomitrium patens]XP_024395645.1 uncharacterized protein LOC112291901 isoform X1 [Physcomitrium patens]|eukprot:XP_024395640.1 uncharacterized protein LOC112291901 isoform X1 [Physcomitrella patens]